MLVSFADVDVRLYHHDPACVHLCLAAVPLAAAEDCWVRRDLEEQLQTSLLAFGLLIYGFVVCGRRCLNVGGQAAVDRGRVEIETDSLRARAATLQPAAREAVCLWRIRRKDRAISQ